MADREKVIRALEICQDESLPQGKCLKCPQYQACMNNGRYVDPLLRDALTLLKAQEPRVMTLEEVKRLLPGADVWIEYHDLTGWKIAAITVREIFDNGLLGELQSLRYSFDRYGRYNGDWLAWRCWTQRPTDEQREAEAWKM